MSFGGDRGQIMTDELKRVSSLRGLWRAYLRVGLMRVRLPTEYGKNPLLVDLREMKNRFITSRNIVCPPSQKLRFTNKRLDY